MNNRDKYISKVNEYDLMMNIKDNINKCPIQALGGTTIKQYNGIAKARCRAFTSCSKCIQSWLNEDAEGGSND